jgi:hypothetical protein
MFAWIVIAMIFGLSIVMFFVAASYSDNVMTEAQSLLVKNYEQNAFGEAILQVPCATESRGVFYMSSIVAGDVGCIDPVGTTHVKFNIADGDVYRFKIERTEDSNTVSAESADAEYTQSYPVSVIDAQNSERHRATLSVGVEIE